ncbi:RNA-binding S4 domain-containing protein [Timonella senegalensis]|jgi:ribosome-associated protein|uniref:RNA-binding S4 domain-containing protein n=1 Tax=Timonella senegalensis TaxID=1465825 RepID=UPI0002D4E6A4|nr:RNA-binding S4 domain-containing protein [Timonella senegalensis]
MIDIEIKDDMIRLGQFLKLADVVENGAHAREVIAAGEVSVNGEIDTRRGRQLTKGDIVTLSTPSGRFDVRVA